MRKATKGYKLTPKNTEPLTWDQLADLYGQRTGGRARTLPMGVVFKWATTQTDIHETEEGYLVLQEAA